MAHVSEADYPNTYILSSRLPRLDRSSQLAAHKSLSPVMTLIKLAEKMAYIDSDDGKMLQLNTFNFFMFFLRNINVMNSKFWEKRKKTCPAF